MVVILIISLSLPKILHAAGLHPDYLSDSFELSDKRALIIATNHGVLNAPGESSGKLTGLFLSELSVPYYRFLDSGIDVDIASIEGKHSIRASTLLC